MVLIHLLVYIVVLKGVEDKFLFFDVLIHHEDTALSTPSARHDETGLDKVGIVDTSGVAFLQYQALIPRARGRWLTTYQCCYDASQRSGIRISLKLISPRSFTRNICPGTDGCRYQSVGVDTHYFECVPYRYS